MKIFSFFFKMSFIGNLAEILSLTRKFSSSISSLNSASIMKNKLFHHLLQPCFLLSSSVGSQVCNRRESNLLSDHPRVLSVCLSWYLATFVLPVPYLSRCVLLCCCVCAARLMNGQSCRPTINLWLLYSPGASASAPDGLHRRCRLANNTHKY